ncbi:extracellular solute-binding protein [Brachybacterium sp. p3-SID957]|uniref:extracellular solute-binding protein n=1 Tax=Brachybacterium sp. p3-SID957 TaxID=2916049 RepID=UPI00223C0219|nr:extracellular solute-binding protein [Brachybacterium sp. p3-SID957]MCT1776278.1 extracellular solute-binding protein [Brachybacterium sp. p3-SID957]
MERITRRGVLAGGITALASGTVLGACSSGGGSGGEQERNTQVVLPTFTKYEGVNPDWKGDETLLDGFKEYPADPVVGVQEPPGDGEPISFITNIPGAIPPQMDANPFWQALNERIGSPLRIDMAPNADYETKFQTKIASGDLPDMINIPPGTADLPGLLESTCMDLTEHLSGDAISAYPYLANLGPDYWRPCVVSGAIYGIPVPRMMSRNFMVLTRRDVMADRGIDPDVQPETWDEFQDLCTELTDPSRNTWALSTMPGNFANMASGIPAGWQRQGDGSFTHFLEHENMAASLEAQLKLWEAGVINPDAFTANSSAKKEWFNGASAIMDVDSFVAWTGYESTNIGNPDFSVGGIVAPSNQGAEPFSWVGSAINNITGFSAGSSHSVETLLAVANWFAAPFGTEEYLFKKYGTAGQQYELQGNDPVPTSRGVQEVGIGVQYIADSPMAFYFPGEPDIAERQFQVQERMSENLSRDMAEGLYSRTRDQKGGELEAPVWDAMSQMAQGLRPISELPDVVKTWRDSGGAEVAEELAEAYDAAGIE